MKEFSELFRYVLAPESDWGKFTRKIISILISASLGAYGQNAYTKYTGSGKGEQPVSVVIRNSRVKEQQVRSLLESIKRTDQTIKSVWLYSWPDALQLVPIMYVGDSVNPIPNGSFIDDDTNVMGTFLFGECAELIRDFKNTSCPINGFEDSWGVLVVNYGQTTPSERSKDIVESVANRISLLLYSNLSHTNVLS